MYSKVAQAKASKSGRKLFVQGIMAGFMIAIGGYASQLATLAGLPKIVGAAIFPAGLIMVILTGSELFTGNCLMAGSVVTKAVQWEDVFRVWGLSYLGNLSGSLLLALCVGVIGSNDYAILAKSVAETKVSMSAEEMLVKGILCNVLVCIAVWMAINANTTAGKIVCAFVPVFVFVFCGFEHSVANMFFLPVVYFLPVQGADVFSVIRQIAVVTVGNIIGGAIVGIALEK